MRGFVRGVSRPRQDVHQQMYAGTAVRAHRITGSRLGIVTVPVQDGWADGRTDNRPVPSLSCGSPQRPVPSPDGGEDGRPVH
jgi:hypothetical protein